MKGKYFIRMVVICFVFALCFKIIRELEILSLFGILKDHPHYTSITFLFGLGLFFIFHLFSICVYDSYKIKSRQEDDSSFDHDHYDKERRILKRIYLIILPLLFISIIFLSIRKNDVSNDSGYLSMSYSQFVLEYPDQKSYLNPHYDLFMNEYQRGKLLVDNIEINDGVFRVMNNQLVSVSFSYSVNKENYQLEYSYRFDSYDQEWIKEIFFYSQVNEFKEGIDVMGLLIKEEDELERIDKLVKDSDLSKALQKEYELNEGTLFVSANREKVSYLYRWN